MSKGMLGMLPLSAVRGTVDALYDNLASDDGERWLQELKKFNRRQVCWATIEEAPQPAQERVKVLRPLALVSVDPLTKPFDPSKFFVTSKGLWVSDDFKTRVLTNAIFTAATDAVMLKPFDLTQNAYDREIKAELPQNHEVALWQIAKLIEAQEGGTPGPLLTNSRWNLFYVAGCVVDVDWNAGRGEWRVGTWHLDASRWRAGRRAFSSN